jgi:hypothetical protein
MFYKSNNKASSCRICSEKDDLYFLLEVIFFSPLNWGQWAPLPVHAPVDGRLEPPLEPAHPGRCAEPTVYSHAKPGGCHLSVLTNSALVIWVQMRGGGGGVAGSQPISTAVHITWHGAQVNFGDLPTYLTYSPNQSQQPNWYSHRSKRPDQS